MKYQATSRILSVVFHGLIFAAFGALASYFAFFVLPFYFSGNPTRWSTNLFEGPYFLYFELAAIGLIMAILSGIGLFHGIKGIINPRDDAPVVKSLTWFIVEGYIASLFWFLQATLLFDLLNASSNNLSFVIIMSLVITVALLIATNIPMVRLYDGKKQDYLFSSVTMGAIISVLVIALCSLLTLIGNWSLSSGTSPANWCNVFFTYIGVAMLIIACVLILAYIALKKGKKSANYLISTATLLTGAQLIGYCVIDILQYENDNCHYNHVDLEWNGYGFDIMGFVLGSVIIFAALYLFYASGSSSAKNEKINKA